MSYAKYRFVYGVFSLLVLTQGWAVRSVAETSDASEIERKDPILYEEPSPTPNKDKGGISVAPVVGYDPTFKFVFGGAFFYEDPKFSFGTDFNLNFKQVYQLHVHVKHVFAKNFEYQLNSGITKGFDPYYGEGGETNPADFTRLWGIKSSSKLKLLVRTSEILKLGIFAEARVRTEEPGLNEPFVRRFPDESSGSVGATAEVDTRDNPDNPVEGFRFTVDATYAPQRFTMLKNVKDFGQVEGSFIVYKQILEELIPDAIAAVRLMGGYSFGEPSYVYRFALGGANQLSGYLDNRFRGRQYYMQQTELRFPIWKLFSGAGMLGFGDAADGKFTNPKLSYGIGLRIGLPPDWVNKVRIDFAWGRDQAGIFANYGQTF